MASEIVLTYSDYGSEKSTVAFQGTDLTAANFDAQAALMDALRTALAGVMIDPDVAREARGNIVSVDNAAASTNPLNQRENKWLVRMRDDTTGDILRREIPGVDLTLLDPDARGFLDISAGVGAALVTAIEAFMLNPATGNSVTVLDVKYVGRNN